MVGDSDVDFGAEVYKVVLSEGLAHLCTSSSVVVIRFGQRKDILTTFYMLPA